MEMLKLSENILHLRHMKRVTQEELADFVGVTKASVSKWETRQSMPDILLLPRLASFFDVTVDELLGYEPQMSREQIRCKYKMLTEDFAEKPFEEVMEHSRSLVRKYFSCYPFLYQISVLWLNHYMLAKTPELQTGILEETAALCAHILKNSNDGKLCGNVLTLKAMVDLQCGRPECVIEALEDSFTFHCGGGENSFLVQAYQMTGDTKKADMVVQADMYQKLLEVITDGMQMIALHQDREDICEEVGKRLEQLMEVFRIGQLNPNMAANYHYQAAITFWSRRREQETYEQLEKFVRFAAKVLQDDIKLHGDSFFYSLDEWIEEQELGALGVRDKRLVKMSGIQALKNPLFADLPNQERLRRMMAVLEKEGEKDA